ncbi:MAG: tetratricopeptide repeat protein [Thermoanaerobaculia bacterium]|nr:tetratricopeptide repeat protein [Thermoanaerobaculia bacterium]
MSVSGVARGLVLLALVAVGCDLGHGDLAEAPPLPEAFAELDNSVQQLFLARRLDVEHVGFDSDPVDTANTYGELAHWFHVYGFASEAEQWYHRAADMDPAAGRWPYFLGHVHLAASRFEAAELAFERSVEKSPGQGPPLLWLAETRRQGGDLEGAEELFLEALDLEQGRAFAEAGLGRIALSKQDYRAARDYLQRALQAQPRASALWYPLSRAYAGLGEESQAQATLSRSPEGNRQQLNVVFPDPWLAELETARQGVLDHLRRGRSARAAGRLGQALQDFASGVAADDDNLDARLEVASVLVDLGRLEAAVHELEAARRAFPLDRRVPLALGAQYLQRREFDAAETQFREGLLLDAEDASMHFNLAQVLRSRGLQNEAITHFEAALIASPEMSRAAFWSAICRLGEQEDLDLIRGRLEEALLAAPEATDVLSLFVRLNTLRGGDVRDPGTLARLEDVDVPTVLVAESIAMDLAARREFGRAAEWQGAALTSLLATDDARCATEVVRRRLERYRNRKASSAPWEPSEILCEVRVTPPSPRL